VETVDYTDDEEPPNRPLDPNGGGCYHVNFTCDLCSASQDKKTFLQRGVQWRKLTEAVFTSVAVTSTVAVAYTQLVNGPLLNRIE